MRPIGAFGIIGAIEGDPSATVREFRTRDELVEAYGAEWGGAWDTLVGEADRPVAFVHCRGCLQSRVVEDGQPARCPSCSPEGVGRVGIGDDEIPECHPERERIFDAQIRINVTVPVEQSDETVVARLRAAIEREFGS